MNMNECLVDVYANAVNKGFYEDLDALEILKENCHIDEKFYNIMRKNAIAARLAFIKREEGEALEELIKGDTEKFEIELADIVLRVFSLAGALDIDLERAINVKMIINKERPRKHGKEF